MKKIIGIVIASLVFCNIGFAEIRLIEDVKIKAKYANYFATTICVDGYKFFSFRPAGSSTTPTTGLVQVFQREITVDGKIVSAPLECY